MRHALPTPSLLPPPVLWGHSGKKSHASQKVAFTRTTPHRHADLGPSAFRTIVSTTSSMALCSCSLSWQVDADNFRPAQEFDSEFITEGIINSLVPNVYPKAKNTGREAPLESNLGYPVTSPAKKENDAGLCLRASLLPQQLPASPVHPQCELQTRDAP